MRIGCGLGILFGLMILSMVVDPSKRDAASSTTAAVVPASFAGPSARSTRDDVSFQNDGVERSRRGLIALYEFSQDDGDRVDDTSGIGEPLHLQVDKPQLAKREIGRLTLNGDTIIRSNKPALKIFNAVRRSGEITVEAWIQPASIDQSGPARVVTISKSSNERNFTMGQDGNKFDCRLRSTETSTNGIPSMPTEHG